MRTRRFVLLAVTVLLLPVLDAAAARYSLSLFKQVGYWINHNFDCGGECGNHVVYITIYDTDGMPVPDVMIIDTDTGTWYASTDVNGNARFTLEAWRTYRIAPFDRYAEVEPSDPMHYAVPDHAGFYSWQVEWLYQADEAPLPVLDPLYPDYTYDAVRPNSETHSDPSYDLDENDLPQDAGLWWGQTFVARSNRILAARVQVTQGAGTHMSYSAAIYECPLDPASVDDIGTRISPIRTSRLINSDQFWDIHVGWGIDEAPVVPGRSYMLKVWNRGREGDERGWLNHWCSTGDYAQPGAAYRMTETGTFGPLPGWDLMATVVGVTVPTPPDDLQLQ